MLTAEERYQLITTLCESTSQTAGSIADHCDILLDETNDLFSKEQKTDLMRIRKAAREISSSVETVRQSSATQRWVSMEPTLICRWVHDLRVPTVLIVGFAQADLEGKVGPLTERQKDAIGLIEKLGQSLQATFSKVLTALKD